MDTESTVMITPSEVIEHLYCPRFTYFMNCLNIPQHEELRYKVMKGRNLHDAKEKENREYLRKKIGAVAKEVSVYVASPVLRVRGVVDEVLTLADGSLSPLDYKYTEYRDYLFETHKVHIVNPFLNRRKPYLSAKGFDLSDEVFIGKSMASDKNLTNDPYKGFFLFIDREMFEVSPYVFQYVFQFNIVSLQRKI